MALTILNNIAAIAAENQLNITSGSLNSTLEQLSSGSRINSGADDPAGLAIANGLAANVAALTQSASNATDGVGELQVADGALSQVTTLLDRAVTLATESATGTVSNLQRTAIDTEYQSIKSEIDSIGSTTNFNGGQVFTANTLNVFLSDGSTSGSSTIGVTTGLLSSAGLNLGGAVAATGTLTEAAGTAAVAAGDLLTNSGVIVEGSAAHNTLTIAGTGPANNDTVTVGTTQYTFVTTLTAGGTQNQVALGGGGQQALINLAAAINATSGQSGTEYGIGTTANTLAHAVNSSATVDTVTANINGVGGAGTGSGVVLVSGTPGDLLAGGATLGAGSGTAGVDGDTVAVGGTTYTFVAALASTPTANEVLYGSSVTTALANLVSAVNQGTGEGTNYGPGTVANANVTAAGVTGHLATEVQFTANVTGTSGDGISGVGSGNTAFASLDFTGGADAGTAPIATAGDTVTAGGQTYTFVNALSTTPTAYQVLVESTDVASLTNLENAVNGGTGLGATYSTGTVANTNVTAEVGTTAAGLDTLTFTSLTKGLSGNSIATSSTSLQTVNPNAFANSELTGGAAGSVNDLLTQSDAQSALTLINNAVATIAALRGNIGSTVNRLQSASSVINNQTQNLTSAENDVTAADIPTVVANLSSLSILEQTGISAIAQANQQQQLVLKLLQ
jgi:flagellin